MSLLLLFVFILVAVFSVVVVFTQPTRAEKLAHSRLEAAAGRGPARVSQRIDILRQDSYSKIPWLNHLFGKLTPAARLQKLLIEADLNWTVGRLLLGSIIGVPGGLLGLRDSCRQPTRHPPPRSLRIRRAICVRAHPAKTPVQKILLTSS